jgi:hypothetical protein
MHTFLLNRFLLLVLVPVLSACTPATRSCGLETSAPTAAVQNGVLDRLFFGREIPSGGSVSDEQWAVFVREEITPRFPDGLTLWQAEGQWLDPRGILVKEPVMIMEVIHPASADADTRIEAIALGYKRRFHQDAVLRVRTAADVRYFDN